MVRALAPFSQECYGVCYGRVFPRRAARGGTARVWGRWQVHGDTALFTIEGFAPQRICDRSGCRPVTMPPESRAPIVRFGSGTIQLGRLMFYRRG